MKEWKWRLNKIIKNLIILAHWNLLNKIIFIFPFSEGLIFFFFSFFCFCFCFISFYFFVLFCFDGFLKVYLNLSIASSFESGSLFSEFKVWSDPILFYKTHRRHNLRHRARGMCACALHSSLIFILSIISFFFFSDIPFLYLFLCFFFPSPSDFHSVHSIFFSSTSICNNLSLFFFFTSQSFTFIFFFSLSLFYFFLFVLYFLSSFYVHLYFLIRSF